MNYLKKKNEDDINKIDVVSKKLSYYLLCTTVIGYYALCIISFTSCSSDDSPSQQEEEQVISPTISLQSGSESTFLGVVNSPTAGSLQYSVKAKAPNGFKSLVIQKIVDGIATEYETIDVSNPNYVAGSNEFTYSLNYTLSENDINKDIKFNAMVTDTNNKTASLNFAETKVKLPLNHADTVWLQSAIPVDPFNVNIKSYLYLYLNICQGTNLGKIVTDQLNEKVAAVLSLNDGSGYYLASPDAVVESDFVIKINPLATTKFKELDNSLNFNDLNIYNTFEVEDLYNNASFNSNQQKAEQLNEGKIFGMQTDSGQIGIFKVKLFSPDVNSITIALDIYWTR